MCVASAVIVALLGPSRNRPVSPGIRMIVIVPDKLRQTRRTHVEAIAIDVHIGLSFHRVRSVVHHDQAAASGNSEFDYREGNQILPTSLLCCLKATQQAVPPADTSPAANVPRYLTASIEVIASRQY